MVIIFKDLKMIIAGLFSVPYFFVCYFIEPNRSRLLNSSALSSTISKNGALKERY